ncbi:MAG: squalene synthase HpnC [Acidobacteria bacterium]|nr:squalene synthase HpnC [Acidobacteriota bacterium]
MNLDAAYAECERVARQHYENFPVASLLLPAPMRPHIAAIYAFARTADDFADEGSRTADERLGLLDEWKDRLRTCTGGPPSPSLAPNPHADPVFLALAETIRVHRLPVQLFEDLLSAFCQDVSVHRYGTWVDVMDYCRRSANPIGRLMLRVAGHVDDRLDAASDAVCTALQLTNFWQDLDRDWRNGRLYVPREDLVRFGAREEDLDGRTITPAWHETLTEMASRTRALFDEGRAVCDGVTGRLRYELRVTWLGGTRVLSRLEANGFDVFSARPALTAPDLPGLVWAAATWTRSGAA